MTNKNTWKAKAKRTLTSLLPVAENRKGKCVDCGECCKLPNICYFLKYTPENKSYCSIHPIRPMNCRKYPRTENEHITQNTCGFKFQITPIQKQSFCNLTAKPSKGRSPLKPKALTAKLSKM